MSTPTMFRSFVCTVLLSGLVIGCASAARVEKMTVEGFKTARSIDDAVFVENSTGGSATNPLWRSNIADE